ncbi:MAG TPA: NYN domain-containing protein [Petrotogaceae bacterium]|nr:NYN domain-containing protein [Petrotogaceae bacterium]HNV05168.1 NYN domain-containing protein [Petrotogaceae bacterium]HNY37208.1 NYN domain-containing protein [Petrotogaceae bacterium]HOG33540.1 NYN domain-containing protein [Petrotogaceae bacterium]
MKTSFILMDYQNQPVDPELIVKKIAEFAKVIGGKAYGHWSKYPATMFTFLKYGIELIEMPEDGFSNKKGNDIKLAVDTIESMFMFPHIESYVLVTGDADFLPLVRKLKTYGKSVIVISRSKTTSADMQLAADMYIPYEDIVKNESIVDIDTFDDLVEEIIRKTDEKNLSPDEAIVKRIITGIGVDYSKFRYTSMNAFVEDILKAIKCRLMNSDEVSEYEENYMRFMERLIVTSITPVDYKSLESTAISRHPWISSNSRTSLKDLIKNMIESKRLIKTDSGILKVPAPRRWEIKYEKLLPYPEYRNNFVNMTFKSFAEKKSNTIYEVLHQAKDSLGLTNKAISSFGIALKFSGMFLGKDGSDYVSIKTPVIIKGSFEQLKASMDTFYIKRILKDEDIHSQDIKYVSEYVFDNQDEKTCISLLKELIQKNEVVFEKPFYKYIRRTQNNEEN